MRHSKKKGDQAPLRQTMDVMGSESDFPPGGNAGGAQGGESSFDASGGTAAADGSGAAESASAGAAGSVTPSDGGERDKYLRLAAEYDNYRKRSAKERQDAGMRAQADLVRQLIEALDDVARFAHVDPATTDAATVVQGVDMVEKKLLKALGAAGLEIINPVGRNLRSRAARGRCNRAHVGEGRRSRRLSRVSARIPVQVAAAPAGARGREAVERLTVFSR